MAPLSAKEKQRRYRERRKQSGKYEEDKERDKIRKRKVRKDMKCSKRKWQNYRKIENERIKLCKLKNKTKMALIQNNESLNEGENSQISHYRSPQALGKAVKKLKRNLPQSPRKQKHVVAAVARSVGLAVSDESFQPKKSNKKISVECERSVIDYFQRDDVSWQAPGKKDRVIIRDKSDGINRKVYLQKRYLRMSMKETHQCYLSEYPEYNIGLTTFTQLKPKQIDFFGNLPHSVCMCRYHENMRLLIEALKPFLGFPSSFREFIDLVTCDSREKSCMNRDCDACRDKIDLFNPENIAPALQNHDIKLYQWQNVEGATKKEEIPGMTLNTSFEMLKEQLVPFLIHTYIKRVQSQYFENLKSEVNAKQIVLQVDFSENFSFKYQNEIQSAHWSNSQCTLFTGYAWINDKESKGFVLVSDCLDHGKLSIYAYMDILLKKLKNSYSEIEEVNVFSDGVSSQFKQRFLFSNLTLLEKSNGVKLTWNYFATSHGKGTVDGIGGAVKGSVWRRIIAKDAIVNAAEEFVAVAKECNKKIDIQFVPMSDIQKNAKTLEERWQNVKAVSNTQRIHHVKPLDDNKILVADESVGLNNNERIVILMEDSIESKNDDDLIRLGSFVKVKISSKRREQFFIAQITNMKCGGSGYEVRYLKRQAESNQVFIDDGLAQYQIDYADVIEVLEVPTIDNRGRYHFKNSVL